MSKQYEISNITSGQSLGVYEGESPEAAWAALAADCGTDEGPGKDILIKEVTEDARD